MNDCRGQIAVEVRSGKLNEWHGKGSVEGRDEDEWMGDWRRQGRVREGIEGSGWMILGKMGKVEKVLHWAIGEGLKGNELMAGW